MSMSLQSLHESLSAAIDGEAEELELRRVLNAVESDADMRAKWQRAHLIGSVLRGESPQMIGRSPDWHAIAAEKSSADADAGMAVGEHRWSGPIIGVGIAAAAMLAVVVYFGTVPGFGTAPSATMPSGIVALDDGAPRATQGADLRRVNDYKMRHMERLPNSGMPFTLTQGASDSAGASASARERRDDGDAMR